MLTFLRKTDTLLLIYAFLSTSMHNLENINAENAYTFSDAIVFVYVVCAIGFSLKRTEFETREKV